MKIFTLSASEHDASDARDARDAGDAGGTLVGRWWDAGGTHVMPKGRRDAEVAEVAEP